MPYPKRKNKNGGGEKYEHGNQKRKWDGIEKANKKIKFNPHQNSNFSSTISDCAVLTRYSLLHLPLPRCMNSYPNTAAINLYPPV